MVDIIDLFETGLLIFTTFCVMVLMNMLVVFN